jgi:hypothetical protein
MTAPMTRRRLLTGLFLVGWLWAGHWAISTVLEPANLLETIRIFTIC